MRKRVVVLAGVIALAGWGCGSDDGSGRSASGEEGARAALTEFTNTFLDAEYDDACAVLTARAKAAFDAGSTCPKALKLAGDLITDKQRKDVKQKSHTVRIDVNGDKAVVDSITDGPCRALLDDHPAVGGAHRADRRSGGDARTAAARARRMNACGR